MMESAREARRKKILDRGSDRLAFITGQTRSVPPSATGVPAPPPTPQSPSHPHLGNNEPSNLRLLKGDFTDGTIEDMVGGQDNMESSPACEISSEQPMVDRGSASYTEVIGQNVETSNKHYRSEESLVALVSHRSSEELAPRKVTQIGPRVFTPTRISNSISATENSRLLCAVTIALLVVLSSHGYSFVNILKSLVNFRPLFLVLLTDVTFVLGNLLGNQENHDKDAAKKLKQDGGNGDDLTKMLETAMVFQKALSAALMDCSVCAVIMICGALV